MRTFFSKKGGRLKDFIYVFLSVSTVAASFLLRVASQRQISLIQLNLRTQLVEHAKLTALLGEEHLFGRGYTE